MISITRIVVGILAGFWLLAGLLVALQFVSVGAPEIARTLGVLMMGNGVALAAAARLILHGNRLVDLSAVALLSANAVLSVSDDIGTPDVVSLVLSCVALTLLAANIRVESKAREPESWR